MNTNIFPSAEVYQLESEFMPWGKLVKKVIAHVAGHAPRNGIVLDMMCGTGHILGELREGGRTDMQYLGVDVNAEFIDYAVRNHPEIRFLVDDARVWETPQQFDVVICTAGIHHLPFPDQEPFIQKLSRLVKPTGFAVLADPHIDRFATDRGRKIAAARLGYEYLTATISAGAPDTVVEAAVQVLENDVLQLEWKTPIEDHRELVKKHFPDIRVFKTWPLGNPERSGYGDYYIITNWSALGK